jgi:hypothetical protein
VGPERLTPDARLDVRPIQQLLPGDNFEPWRWLRAQTRRMVAPFNGGTYAMIAKPRHDIPGDDSELARLSEMVVALLCELSIVTERLDTVERLLDRAQVILASDIEAYIPDAGAQQERDARRQRQLAKVFRPLRDDAEQFANHRALVLAGSIAGDS